MKRLWLGCFVVAAAWLATVAIVTLVAGFEDPPRPRPSPDTHVFATEELDGLNAGGWLVMIVLPATFVVVSTVYYVSRRFFAKPS